MRHNRTEFKVKSCSGKTLTRATDQRRKNVSGRHSPSPAVSGPKTMNCGRLRTWRACGTSREREPKPTTLSPRLTIGSLRGLTWRTSKKPRRC